MILSHQLRSRRLLKASDMSLPRTRLILRISVRVDFGYIFLSIVAYRPPAGVAMFICTYIYIYIWVRTAESTAKRIRERYLKAILRQDIAFFDKVGAGEVTTRIQTDTRTWFFPFRSRIRVPTGTVHTPRFGPTGFVRKGRPRGQLLLGICYWFRLGVCEKLAASSGHEFDSTLHRHHGCNHEQICCQICAVSLVLRFVIYCKFI